MKVTVSPTLIVSWAGTKESFIISMVQLLTEDMGDSEATGVDEACPPELSPERSGVGVGVAVGEGEGDIVWSSVGAEVSCLFNTKIIATTAIITIIIKRYLGISRFV